MAMQHCRERRRGSPLVVKIGLDYVRRRPTRTSFVFEPRDRQSRGSLLRPTFTLTLRNAFLPIVWIEQRHTRLPDEGEVGQSQNFCFAFRARFCAGWTN